MRSKPLATDLQSVSNLVSYVLRGYRVIPSGVLVYMYG